jgi:hypothetical protein
MDEKIIKQSNLKDISKKREVLCHGSAISACRYFIG